MQDNMYGALTSAVQSFGGVGEAWKAYKSYQKGSPVQPTKVSTGTSMVPYTGGGALAGVGGEVQQMGPFESMMIILEDMRDGIWETANTISDIAVRGLPTYQGGAAEQAQRQTGRSETEGGGKPIGILGSIKGAFSGLIPEGGFGDKLKILAFAGALWALSKWSDDIVPVVAKIVKWTKETLMPMLMKVLDFIGVTDEEGEINWTKLLGMGLAAYVALKIGPALLSLAFKIPGGAKVMGVAGLAVWAYTSALQITGDAIAAQEWTSEEGATDTKWANMIGGALGGDIQGGIVNAMEQAGKWAGPFALVGAGIGSVVPVVGTLAGALIGGVIGLIFGGIMGFIGGGKIAKFFEDIGNWVSEKWNAMTQSIKDIFFDREITTMVAGREMKHTQRSKIGGMMDSMQELEKNINEWMDGVWDKMTGWIPSWDDVKDKWGDMTTKVKTWEQDMEQWFKDMWEKVTGWIPTVADIKESVGDMKVWIKNMMIDIKNWFWDASKPQIIGIDLSKISDAFPSIEGIKEGILSTLPDWMRPKTLEQQIDELEDKIERSEAGENVFFGRETKGRKKAKEKIAELRALLLEEAEEGTSIDGVSNRMNFEVANMRKVASTSGQALAAVASARGIDESQRTMTTFVDGKAINSYNQQKTDVNIIEPGVGDPDGTAKQAWSGQGFNLAAWQAKYE